jgi:hypothetical protein
MAGKRPTGINDSEVRMRAKERGSNEGEVSRKGAVRAGRRVE